MISTSEHYGLETDKWNYADHFVFEGNNFKVR